MTPDFRKVQSLADAYQPAMSSFLRDMVAIPSESRNEKAIITHTPDEMIMKQDLSTAAAMYAVIPWLYVEQLK